MGAATGKTAERENSRDWRKEAKLEYGFVIAERSVCEDDCNYKILRLSETNEFGMVWIALGCVKGLETTDFVKKAVSGSAGSGTRLP